MTARRRVALLGATGSIGRQTLDVLRREPASFELVSIAGGTRLAELAEVAREFGVRRVGVARPEDYVAAREILGDGVEVLIGGDGLAELARDADVVVNAVVGFAGLPVTISALDAGRTLALANKESFIAAAPLVARVRDTPGALVLPIDSEHCAIYQCLADSNQPGHPDVRRLLLTASGGPFRGWSRERLETATRDDALIHPTWSMGPKITIDSSTLMNKGLEVLEASALFGVDVDRIQVVVHPQSIVHSMVEYVDGSVIAQLSQPDMRLPIAYCLGRPVRFDHAWGALDFTAVQALTFEPPDLDAFPAIPLAYAAARRGGAAPAWLSAANEVAVAAFLHDAIHWTDIVPIVAGVMDQYQDVRLESVEALVHQDQNARRLASDLITRGQ
ncbi:MAG: 1-deoxy-D-xylulose-5-phosphate reductoisomerase [Actinomycetales bacterium]|nr:1-deoxy-D-xylulose-5-phosphate reductoisomerase [Actinomycetales bacterium]